MTGWRPYLLLVFAGTAWGFGFPLAKLALRETDAAHMILLRLAVAGLFALPLSLRSKAARAMWRSPPTLLAGAIYGPPFILQFEGLARTTVSLAGLLVGLLPALVAAGSRLWGERPTRGAWAGVAAATFGGGLIAAGAGTAGGSLLGAGLVVASLALFVTYVGVARRIPAEGDAIGGAAVVIVVAGAAAGVLVLIGYGPPKLDLSPVGWGAIAFQGVVCTALATLAWQIGSPHVPSASAGVFINLEPVVASALGVSLFGDRLTVPLLIGGALIVAGSLATVLAGRPAAATLKVETAA